MTMTSDIDVCRTCRQTWLWHTENKPRHQFVNADQQASESFLSAAEKPNHPVQNVQMPFDPVLRMALIEKGVLTPEDLSKAESIIKYVSGGSDGREGPPESGLPQGQ